MKSLITIIPLSLLLLFTGCSAAKLRDVDGDELIPYQEYYLKSALYGGGAITTSCILPFVVETEWNDTTLAAFPVKFFPLPNTAIFDDQYNNIGIQFATSGCPQYGLFWKRSQIGPIGVGHESSLFNIRPHNSVENAYDISVCLFPTFIACQYAVLGKRGPNGLAPLIISSTDPMEAHPIFFVKASAALPK